MTTRSAVRVLPAVAVAIAMSACGSGAGPTRQVPVGPTAPGGPGGSGSVTLGTPSPVSPINGEQLSTLRPTLTVQNVTSSNQSGTRTYEFQVSDRSDFTLGASLTASFLVAVNQTGVAEGGDGRTSFAVGSDLQSNATMYWRARATQGTTTSSWSDPATFRTPVGGYNRPGELYDPLINGTTIGQRFGATSFVSGRGIRLDNETSYVRYELPQALTSGEFSVLVEGLQGGDPGEKLKIFSMSDTTNNLLDSPYLMNVQYRGALPGDGANPNNSFSFKVLYGSEARKFEPSKPNRRVAILNRATTYLWTATWSSSEFRLVVREGGPNGAVRYDHAESAFGTYNPAPHYAYLGANNKAFGSAEGGTRSGAIIRQVWISSKPRPDTLGNALE